MYLRCENVTSLKLQIWHLKSYFEFITFLFLPFIFLLLVAFLPLYSSSYLHKGEGTKDVLELLTEIIGYWTSLITDRYLEAIQNVISELQENLFHLRCRCGDFLSPNFSIFRSLITCILLHLFHAFLGCPSFFYTVWSHIHSFYRALFWLNDRIN